MTAVFFWDGHFDLAGNTLWRLFGIVVCELPALSVRVERRGGGLRALLVRIGWKEAAVLFDGSELKMPRIK